MRKRQAARSTGQGQARCCVSEALRLAGGRAGQARTELDDRRSSASLALAGCSSSSSSLSLEEEDEDELLLVETAGRLGRSVAAAAVAAAAAAAGGTASSTGPTAAGALLPAGSSAVAPAEGEHRLRTCRARWQGSADTPSCRASGLHPWALLQLAAADCPAHQLCQQAPRAPPHPTCAGSAEAGSTAAGLQKCRALCSRCEQVTGAARAGLRTHTHLHCRCTAPLTSGSPLEM